MCGILALYSSRPDAHREADDLSWEAALPVLSRRGPDAQGLITIQTNDGATLKLGSSLLHLRGTEALDTPPQTTAGHTLLFNGEIFGGLNVPCGGSDSLALLRALSQPGADVAAVASQLEGPWAFCFWQNDTQTLWVGRDAFGRRSLLLYRMEGPGKVQSFIITSVPLMTARGGGPPEEDCSASAKDAGRGEGTGNPAVSARAEGDEAALDSREPWATSLHEWQELPPGIASICFGSDVDSGNQSCYCWKQHPWQSRRVASLLHYTRDPSLIGHTCSADGHAQEAAVAKALQALRAAVKQHSTCWDVSPGDGVVGEGRAAEGPHPSPILILFSGGVDSTLLAALAHESLPEGVPIDLATICFDGGRSPDRQSATAALQELARIAPTREWRLIEVDCTLADIDQHRSHILGLLHPADTMMDLNIGSALWLAARGVGPARVLSGSGQETRIPGFRSAARIVVVGHGADEQCAGYGRHRTKFRQTGYAGLQAELQLDMRRLWRRNLGRDDRLISDHGRESRHPFLDEAFMDTVLNLPLPLVADLDLPVGQGDKKVLRLALRLLGLPEAAGRAKRAIQFGTHLGKLANIAAFGSNRGNARHAGSMKLSHLPA